MILADLGADVIKVERPGTGDETRGWGPPFDDRGESAYFLSINRNKRSLAADLRADRDLILRLIAGADVVLDNFLSGALERAGIVVDALLREHPRLIWCTITGFGIDSVRPGYDFVVQAELGWMAITGPVDGEPHKIGVALADVIAGKDAALAILAALVARANSNVPRNRYLVISLAASARAALVNVAQNTLVSGRDAKRWGNAHPNLVPYQLFHAQDRAIVIAVGSDAQWRACTRALGLHDLDTDASLNTNAGRLAERERVVATIEQRVREQPAAHWLATLDAAGVPAGIVKTVLEALRDAGGSPHTGIAPSVPGGTVRLSPPRLDEHGAEIRRNGWASPAAHGSS